jgi:hypothetical protein
LLVLKERTFWRVRCAQGRSPQRRSLSSGRTSPRTGQQRTRPSGGSDSSLPQPTSRWSITSFMYMRAMGEK